MAAASMARVRPSPSGRAIDLLTYNLTALALPTTLYVDAATLTPLSDQYGTAVAPYSTLTAAVARANASSDIAFYFVISFGNYQSEAPLMLLSSRRYIFEGVFRSSVIMRLPTVVWTVASPGTSFLLFRNVEAGLVTVLDGSPVSTTAVIVYENSACQGINAATSLATLTVLMSGTSLASYQTSTNTFVLAVARLAAINLNNGTLFAQNVQFDSTCPLVRALSVLAAGCAFSQSMQIEAETVEIRESLWTVAGGPFSLTFMGAAGLAFLDSSTQHHFDTGEVTLVNGSFIATDQHYDTSSVIPLPEGSTTGQATLGTAVTFAGASYRLVNFASANRLYIVATAVSAPTTLVIAVYQSPSGQTTPPLPLVGVATLLLTAPGTFLVPLAATLRLVPGVAFFLVGKVAGGGNITVRTYTTPTQELLNDASVPSAAYPTAFTTTIGVTTTPPATFNPTPAGGLVTPAGASNVTLIVRLATV